MAADLSKFPSLASSTHNGNELALKLLADLTNPLFEAGCVWQESLCRAVLEECEDKNLLMKIDSSRKIPKKVDKKAANSTDIFAKLNSFTPNQQKNHALRFGVEQAAAAGTHRGSTWGFKSFVTGSSSETRDYEDVLSQEILDAPICDVCIIQYGEAVPDGFYRLLKTPSNKKGNLNSGSGGNPIYLCIKKDLTGKAAPIVNFIVIFPDRSEYVPPGYHVVQRGKTACNINTGTGSERVYLCYKKDFLGNPLIDIQVTLTVIWCFVVILTANCFPPSMHDIVPRNLVWFYPSLCYSDLANLCASSLGDYPHEDRGAAEVLQRHREEHQRSASQSQHWHGRSVYVHLLQAGTGE